MEASPSKRDFPSVQDLLTKKPLYEGEDISNLPDKSIWEIEYFQGSIDAYCVECKKPSVFKSEVPPRADYSLQAGYVRSRTSSVVSEYTVKQYAQNDRTFTIELSCTRVPSHRIWFFFRVWRGNLIKVGQHPSFADFHLADLDKYDRILTKEQRQEFAKAIGLHAHGIGIGSFIYLRRIFESLVEKAHEEARVKPEWIDNDYERRRMHEKIMLLKDYLPEALVENADIYSILSKGVHSLSDSECLQYFDTVKIGIEYILNEELERRDKEKREKQWKEQVARVKEL